MIEANDDDDDDDHHHHHNKEFLVVYLLVGNMLALFPARIPVGTSYYLKP